ncbi:MAG: hypothetical protein A2Y17_02655 [Clostridiales bacterium GWF2_38_85]|nr:MAG: hypothetical protein A2Y17_02655 [Clostridiales bacterium GWF2_38_85]
MILNWLRKFLYGRYNKLDALNLTMLVSSFLVSLINSWFIVNSVISFILWLVSTVLCAFTILRILSRDVYKRSNENQIFINKTAPVSRTVKLIKVSYKERKTNRIVVCPNCKTMLRLPKGKKNILVTCVKCKSRFDA